MIHKIILGMFMTTAYVLGVTTGMLMVGDHYKVSNMPISYNMFKAVK